MYFPLSARHRNRTRATSFREGGKTTFSQHPFLAHSGRSQKPLAAFVRWQTLYLPTGLSKPEHPHYA
jgi:hypothetical protein